jgi:lactate racemase
MKTIHINYGKETVNLLVDEQVLRHELKPKDTETVESVPGETVRALGNPVGTDRLRNLVKKGNRIVLLADDITRPTPSAEIIPQILEEINSGGVPDENITLVIALGTHRPMTDKEILTKYGREVVNRIRIINHDCLDRDNLKPYGTTQRGTEIWVNRFVVEADFRIGIGNIVPHHPTGWSGGAKILLPGAAGQYTTGQFHLLGANQQMLGHVDTPCRQEMEDFASSTGLEFIVNSVLDREGRVVRIVAGHMIDAHREGVRWAESVFGAPFTEKTDITLSSTYPVDFDLFQADKGLFSAAISTKPGGEIILLSPCHEGVSPTHPESVELAPLSDEELFRICRDPGSKSDPLSVAEVLYLNSAKHDFKVTLVSEGIPDHIAAKFGFAALKVKDIQNYLDRKLNGDMTLGIIHNSAETLPLKS